MVQNFYITYITLASFQEQINQVDFV